MQIKLENLEKIDDILKDIELIKNHLLNSKPKKRWLSTKELALYIPYSVETINKKVQDETFIYGIHFYQKEKTRMFDSFKIDEWIMSEKLSSKHKFIKEGILKDFNLEV